MLFHLLASYTYCVWALGGWNTRVLAGTRCLVGLVLSQGGLFLAERDSPCWEGL